MNLFLPQNTKKEKRKENLAKRNYESNSPNGTKRSKKGCLRWQQKQKKREELKTTRMSR